MYRKLFLLHETCFEWIYMNILLHQTSFDKDLFWAEEILEIIMKNVYSFKTKCFDNFVN